MFCTVLNVPMDSKEETAVLEQTGAPRDVIEQLVNFAARYRESMSAAHAPKSTDSSTMGIGVPTGGSEGIQRSRKLGTRTLVRIARRIAKAPWDDDLYSMITRTLLAEFLPAAERMAIETLLDEAGIRRLSDVVSNTLSD